MKNALEAEWLSEFLEDVLEWMKHMPSICIHSDSQSAIEREQINMYNGRSGHIRHIHKIIIHLVSCGIIFIDYVSQRLI